MLSFDPPQLKFSTLTIAMSRIILHPQHCTIPLKHSLGARSASHHFQSQHCGHRHYQRAQRRGMFTTFDSSVFVNARTVGDSSLQNIGDEGWKSVHYPDNYCLVTNIPLGCEAISILGARHGERTRQEPWEPT
jgi:hypothetical protein